MYRFQSFVLGTIATLAFAGAGLAQQRAPVKRVREPLVEQVRKAIDRGIQFLRDQQNNDGGWEVDTVAPLYPGGETSLALLALLNSGVKPEDPIIERGLKYLRTIEPRHTYVVGLQTMAFAQAGKKVDGVAIQRNVDWLVNARVLSGRIVRGWSYQGGGAGGAREPDNSNTQYALLGLHEGHRAGARIDRGVWESIREFYTKTQKPDGSWEYQNHRGSPGRLTMTTAGVCGLYIAGAELNEGRETFREDGSATNCGVYEENKVLQKGHAWIGSNRRFNMNLSDARYYNLYGIERTGRLSGLRFLGDHDWYREGCELLVRLQNTDDGSWKSGGPFDTYTVVSTSFALLFLSKGRTPLLVSKLMHGPGDDWNNDRHDIRNLVEYASTELFKKQPLAWQIFDAKRVSAENQNELLEVTSDLLQAPIVYFNGHRAPQFTANEERLLKEYIEQGGFILAEACCGEKNFDAGFRNLVQRLFPDNELKPLPADHPLWRAHADVPPGSFKLEGVHMGCKTVIVYSPEDLSCRWEANKTTDGLGQLAFRLGCNIIAYATGMELPKPRLTKVEVISTKDDQKKVPRGYLKVAQLRHEGDWQPAPKAMRNLMLYLRDKPRLDVAVQTEAIAPSNPDLADFKFLYLHGRSSFTFTDEELTNLRADLSTGGFLLADACCGKKPFDASFREFANRLFPSKKLEAIPLSDELYGRELNGAEIRLVHCRREKEDGSGPETEYRDVPPLLEGIKHNNRWVVVYSRYDLGCALEKHPSSDCLGHDHDSAIRLASAAVYYALKR